MKKLLISLMAIGCLQFVESSHAQVPQIINFQGRVTIGGTNFNGTGGFKFSLVDASGNATYWSNGVSATPVTVTKGLYSVLLGGPGMNPILPSVFVNSQVYLRVWFNDGITGLQLLSPDQRIVAVGYAMVAGGMQAGMDSRLNDKEIYFRPGADTNHGLGWHGAGKEFAGINVDGPVLYGFSGGGLGSTAGGEKLALKWDSAGNVGIGTATPGQKLVIRADDTATYPDSKTLLIQGDTDPNQQLEIGYKTSGDYAAIQSIRQFAGVKPLLLNPGGGNVGIGTGPNAPQAALHVNGEAIIGASTNSPTFGMVAILNSTGGVLFVHPAYTTASLNWDASTRELSVKSTYNEFDCSIEKTTQGTNIVEAAAGYVFNGYPLSLTGRQSHVNGWHVIAVCVNCSSGARGTPGFRFEGTSLGTQIQGLITYWN